MPGKEKRLPSTKVRYAEGNGFHLGNAKNMTVSFRALSKQFEEPLTTHEKFAEYNAMSDVEKGRLKRMPGWVIRCPVEKGKRTRDSVQPGRLITIDIDDATPAFSEQLLAGNVLPGVALFAHTTRGHTPENPRFRLFILGNSEIDADHYQRVCRITAQQYDEDLSMTDKVSARVAQLMYRPSVSKNMRQQYIHHEQPGDEWDWQKAVRQWEKTTDLDSNDIKNLPRFKGEKELRESAENVEDPLLKQGPVGDWCRAFNCVDLVLGKNGTDPMLAHAYEVSDWGQDGLPSRFSYIPGHSTNGVVIYRDGDLVYSHHGSDPATDMTLNSWDLCRYHLFDAAEDDEALPMGQRESWKKMMKFVADFPAYRDQRSESRYNMSQRLTAFDLDDDDLSWVERESDEEDLIGEVPGANDGEDLIRDVPMDWADPESIRTSLHESQTTTYKRMRAEKPPENWIARLDLNQDGTIRTNTPNISMIVANDPRLHRKIAFNGLNQADVLLADIKIPNPAITDLKCLNRHTGTPIDVLHRDVVKSILEGPTNVIQGEHMKAGWGYGLPNVSTERVKIAIRNAGQLNAFHPVKDLIQKWRDMGPPETDPIPGFLHRHVGCEDSQYTTDIMRMKMIASVYRIETPGLKFDYAIIFKGRTGIGKSTLVRIIYGDEYFGELDVDLGNRQKVEEAIRRKWAMEMSELSSMRKSESEHAKSFMRRQNDEVRRAYGEDPVDLPRQFVVWGTTNKDLFLKDETGNRSYWIVECGNEPIDLRAVYAERENLWRQAVYDQDQMRKRIPTGNLPLTLKGAALDRAVQLQEASRMVDTWEEWANNIIDWFEHPRLAGILCDDMGIQLPDGVDYEDRVLPVAINQVLAIQVLEKTGSKLPGTLQTTAWQNVRSYLEELRFEQPRVSTTGKLSNHRVGGKREKWIHYVGATDADLDRGFRLIGNTGLVPAESCDDLI
ncbi:virulence-associated E family protein [Sulfitobacter aestuariivivens]|nr:virulence-associated E family protein [Sulfitobacter aestuariivivens]